MKFGNSRDVASTKNTSTSTSTTKNQVQSEYYNTAMGRYPGWLAPKQIAIVWVIHL